MLFAGSEDSNKQPGSRSQKLELGKGGGGSVSKQALSQTSFLSRLVSGRISRRAIVVGKHMTTLHVSFQCRLMCVCVRMLETLLHGC